MLESQDDVVAGDTGRDKILRDPLLGPIILDPRFIAPQVDVDHAAVDAMNTLPPGIHQLVMALRVVENQLRLDVSRGGPEPGVILDHAPHGESVSFPEIHWTIRSSRGRKTMMGRLKSSSAG